MAFELIGEEEVVKADQVYFIKLYFDVDTNTQRHEYVLNDEILYGLEYEAYPHEIYHTDISLESIVSGFDAWYEQFGPNWRPQAFSATGMASQLWRR